jgi:5-(carboxyamino)imidazole ribonucleotide synthase
MRRILEELGHPLPVWRVAETAADVAGFLEVNGGRIIAKAPRGGYDGKGVAVVTDAAQVAEWLDQGPVLMEEMVDFSRELAQLVARRPNGETAVWPAVETTQANGVCAEVILPAPTDDGRIIEVAAKLGRQIANDLNVTGVLAVELFETTDGRLLVNELAMRPHNSGHVTIEGSVTSQFEQHLRAICDMPLGATDSLHPWAVMVNVFGSMDLERYSRVAQSSDVKLHNYGKEPRAGRKVGHVTATGTDVADTTSRARAVAEIFHADI